MGGREKERMKGVSRKGGGERGDTEQSESMTDYMMQDKGSGVM